MTVIPLTKPSMTDEDRQAVMEAMASPHLQGGGPFSEQVEQHLQDLMGAPGALLTHSGTAALEMAILLAEVEGGDEVIMPSFTFPSTANAVVLRGATPVFVEINHENFNIDLDAVEAAITPKTKAIIVVHYAAICCDMDRLAEICSKHDIMIIEDAAQAIGAKWRGKMLGSFGALAAFSFHATKNISSGEGGALIINDPALVQRAEILLEKGTSRRQFQRGAIDKYTWVDVGSSYLPGEMTAALLLSQLKRMEQINAKRLQAWHHYADHPKIRSLAAKNMIQLQTIPADCNHNAHLFVILLPTQQIRDDLSLFLGDKGIMAHHHYVPLHDAEAGLRYGRFVGSMEISSNIAERLVRLPLFADITLEQIEYIIDSLHGFLTSQGDKL